MDRYGPLADEEIIEKVKQGDDRAFNELIGRYKKMGFSMAYNMTGSTEDAEDLSQEAFVIVYNKIDKFRGDSSFKTWFYRILLNLCRGHHRREKVTSFFSLNIFNKESEDMVVDPAGGTDPQQEMHNRQKGRAIMDAVRKLPGKQREVFIMKHIKGMKIREIADVLESAEGTIKTHLFRAVRELQGRLKGYCDEL